MSAKTISIIITTYGTQSYYTQACLESIRTWKNSHHEIIVVVHDESPLLRAYLDACVDDKLIDRLIFAVPGHGHTRGFNLGLQHTTSDVVFNICNDILIGPSLVDHCAWDLRHDKQLGMIGWHWHNEGTLWHDGRVTEFALKDPKHPSMGKQAEDNIRNAHWFTGKLFEAIGGTFLLCLCNTSFFGMRRDLLERIGGFGKEYHHFWADDFLNYAVLDQGLDIRHFERQFRTKPYFHEFRHDNPDINDRCRNDDRIGYNKIFINSINLINGGMTEAESIYLHLLARTIPSDSVVTNVGTWMGASAIILLDALRDKPIKFNFIDCFDIPGISNMSMQPPVTIAQFRKNISQYISKLHTINIIKTNTLILDNFPKSDFIFVDAGHTKQCITHDTRLAKNCLTTKGVAVFHDYNQQMWPDVKPSVDEVFDGLDIYKTMATHRCRSPKREQFQWP